jgi:MFS transporter, putative metabolite:H+ symporter
VNVDADRALRNRSALVLAGFACVMAGAALHWPDFVMASSMGFRLSGMPVSPLMLTGMALIVAGLVLTALGVALPALRRGAGEGPSYRVEAMDERRLTGADVRLLAVLVFGLVIDVMKPATISFIIPGAKAEYGLTTAQITFWPLVALTGTAIGSLAWGTWADRIGRRGAMLLAVMLFIATSICGAMPWYGLNLVMCFLMGASAGGMLPLVFALLAEVAPRRHRGLLAVLIGGLGSAGGYLAASGAAALLEPVFSWRVLWLIGLPTGLVMVLLSRFIPESPRFLILNGRSDEARRALAAYGAKLEVQEGAPELADHATGSTLGSLVRAPYAVQTLGMVLFGFAWGVANFGFLTWLPTLLRRGTEGAALWNGVLAKSALIALPGAVLVMVLYGRWRTRASIVTFALLSALALVVLGTVLAQTASGLVVGLLMVVLLVAINGSNAMISVYAAEVYPTALRGRGTGLVAAATKLGGLLGPLVVAAILILGGGPTATAWLVALPLCVAAVILWRRGIETRERSLAEIQATIGR